MLDGELLCIKILEVNLLAFAYRLFHEDFSPIDGALSREPVDWREIFMKQSVGKCKQINPYSAEFLKIYCRLVPWRPHIPHPLPLCINCRD